MNIDALGLTSFQNVPRVYKYTCIFDYLTFIYVYTNLHSFLYMQLHTYQYIHVILASSVTYVI